MQVRVDEIGIERGRNRGTWLAWVLPTVILIVVLSPTKPRTRLVFISRRATVVPNWYLAEALNQTPRMTHRDVICNSLSAAPNPVSIRGDSRTVVWKPLYCIPHIDMRQITYRFP